MITSDVVVNVHHFLLSQLPVEEDQFIQIHPGVVVIFIDITFPEDQSSISGCTIQSYPSLLNRNQSAVLENLQTLVIVRSNVIHHQVDPHVLHFGDVQGEVVEFQVYVETES